jgi:hypothetical protein
MVQVWNRVFGGKFLGVRTDCWLLLALLAGTTATLVLVASLTGGSRETIIEAAEPGEPEPEQTAGASDENPAMAISKAEEAMLADTVQGMRRKKQLPLFVYQDAGIGNFYPDGWMGDYRDIRMDSYDAKNPRSGKTCLKIDYKPGASLNCRWAGVYWVFPGSNWGTRKGGYDLSGAHRLSFWARGEKGGEVIQEFKIGGIAGKFHDSDTAGIGPIELSTEWKRYEIELEGVDLSYISGGFCWSTNLDRNKDGCTFYLDDIVYE